MREKFHPVLLAVKETPKNELPILVSELTELLSLAVARLAAPAVQPEPDTLLDVEEAAHRLHVSEDYLYHHHPQFAFTRRVGRKLLFSASGIEAYISKQGGLTTWRHGARLGAGGRNETRTARTTRRRSRKDHAEVAARSMDTTEAPSD
jgi:hypothetical protein